MKFNDWILNELRERNWSQAELAKRSGLTRSVISKYMTGRTPDDVALRKLAKAFNLPQETVFRAAGSLDPRPVSDTWAETMNHKIGQLTGARREMAERLLNTLLDEQDREIRQVTAKPAKP